jgi:hypothetical protein
MLTIEDLQHGDQIWVSDRNLMSALIQNAQGDFEWSHVCSFWILDGKPTILTTGACFSWRKMAFVYGAVDAVEYLSKRKWIAQRRVDLTPEMQAIRLQTLLRLRNNRTPYAVAKLLKLASWRFKSGVADKIHDPPELHPDKVFCSESEALSIIEAKRIWYRWQGLEFNPAHARALREVNSKYPQKLEACVHTPETLYDAPEAVLITPSNPEVKLSFLKGVGTP